MVFFIYWLIKDLKDVQGFKAITNNRKDPEYDMSNMQKMSLFMFWLVTFSYKLHESCKWWDYIFDIRKVTFDKKD